MTNMMINKNKIMIMALIIAAAAVYVTGPAVIKSLRWKLAADAAGGLPYQIGLTNVIMIKCITTGYPPICQGGMLCYTKDAATCSNYYDVSGMQSGGMGRNALFSQMAISQSGLNPGGQLIAGGMSPVFMDNGVLASGGGCYNCLASLGKNPELAFWEKIIIYFKALKL